MRGTTSSAAALQQHRKNFMTIVSQKQPSDFVEALFDDIEQRHLVLVGGCAERGGDAENRRAAHLRNQHLPATAKPRSAEEARDLLRMLWTVMAIAAP